MCVTIVSLRTRSLPWCLVGFSKVFPILDFLPTLVDVRAGVWSCLTLLSHALCRPMGCLPLSVWRRERRSRMGGVYMVKGENGEGRRGRETGRYVTNEKHVIQIKNKKNSCLILFLSSLIYLLSLFLLSCMSLFY